MQTDRLDRPLYNTAAVTQQTGIPAATFRAWERRYGFPRPHRDGRGRRLYSERDVRAIRWLHEQTAQGVSISRAVAMLRQGYAQPAAGPGVDQGPRSFRSLCQELIEALLDFDSGRADALLAEAFGLYTVEAVCVEVIEPVLVAIGERWHAGEVSIAEEHYASSLLRARLFSLLSACAPSDRGPVVFTACAPGEWHEVGILMISVFLARQGYRVRYLGPDLPVDELKEPVERFKPALVTFSVGSLESAQRLTELQPALRELRAAGSLLAFGGRVFNERPELRAAVPGVYLGRSAKEALAAVQRLLGA